MATILVIEDERLLREEVTDWLHFEGYEAVGVQDGMAGVQYATQNPPDLIICDITMPRLDGYGVLLEIRANPLTTEVPFIFVTARAATEEIRIGMGAGADDYVTKPFTRSDLLATVESRLQKKVVQEQKHQRELEQLQKGLALEREQRVLTTKLVAMLSHDFRTPLTTIMSSNSLLRDYADRMDEAHRLQHLDHIDTAVRQLVQMLDDILIVAQIETGKLEFHPEPINLKEFFQNILAEFQAVRDTHQYIFECACVSSVQADARLLRQIGANLISNAVKYSSRGSTVRVTIAYGDGQWSLNIADQGIGIPENDMPHLFADYQRGSNVGNIKGTGLGLAIVKQAVELHGGTISIQTQEGAGTTVTVNIPLT